MAEFPPRRPSDGSGNIRRRGTLAAWTVVLLWGFHYVVIYRPLRLIDPERYLVMRFEWAALVVLLISLFIPLFRGISPGDWVRLLLLALVGIVGYQWVFLRAASILDPVPLVLILSLGPVVVALYSHFRGHETFSPFQWGAMGMVCLGIFLVVRGESPPNGEAREMTTGLALASVSLVFFAISTLLSRKLLSRVTALQTTLIPILLGALIILPVHPGYIIPPAGDRTAIIMGPLFYSVFVALFLAYFLWNVAVSDIGPTRASLWVNGQPLVTAAGSVLFLGHHFSWIQGAGGILAMAGFWIFFGKNIFFR